MLYILLINIFSNQVLDNKHIEMERPRYMVHEKKRKQIREGDINVRSGVLD